MVIVNALNLKYCSYCVLSIGLAYFLLKTTNIQRLIRLRNKWFNLNINEICIVSTHNECLAAVGKLRRKLQKSEKPIIGLDCEWVSTKGKRQPVAILQVATSDGFCSIFRLTTLKNISADLLGLLEDKNVVKVGVAVINDAQYLMADYGVRCQSCLDLRHLAAEVGAEARGLGSLANELIGVQLNKDWRIRCSDWEAPELTPTQVQYAAEDAFVAVTIFDVLNHKEICKRYSLWKRLTWSKNEYWNESLSLWNKFIGRNFKGSNKQNIGTGKISGPKSKSEMYISKRSYNTTLHRPHYSNIFLLAPDNQVLCTIGDSKAAWYIDRGLADTVSDNPKTLRLKFEPSCRTNEPDGYYTKPKENRCVVCGSTEDLRRKNVVPNEYRRCFEEKLKTHHSYDVLLLCLACHMRSNLHDHWLRETLASDCQAPLADGTNTKFCEVPDLRALRNAARALYNSGNVIPNDRKSQLEAVICDKLGVSPQLLTNEYLENISNIDCRVEREKYSPHGLKVVQYYESHGGVEELERRWRQHFIDTMSPKFMPSLWTVDYVRD